MSELEDSVDFNLIDAVKKYMELMDRGKAPSPEAYAQTFGASEQELIQALEGLLLVHQPEPPKPRWREPEPEPMAGEPIGDFQILHELGRGGMGVVYQARQRSLGRQVALKILPFASALDEVRLQRFHNEAHAAAALHHTHIVPVYAVGQERGVHYYAMQLIDGRPLSDTIHALKEADRKGVSRMGHVFSGNSSVGNDSSGTNWNYTATNVLTSILQRERMQYYRWAVTRICEAAQALDHAHRYGVIHRDIKPSNLLLDSNGKIWLTDFGLAQIESEPFPLTQSGLPLGTMRYMSPEQAQGNRLALDHRTDIYSLGITLYELLTLQPAFNASNAHQLMTQVIHQEPPSLRHHEPTLPEELEVIVQKATAKSPEDRYATAQGFADDLHRWLHDQPIVARPPTLFDRVNKWRRRNSGIVASAGVILTIITLCLATTTALVWQAQRQTKQALLAEQEQRVQAEAAFQNARAAVDAFSQLSESELTMRPDLQNLRRGFLETTLEFYSDFLAEHGESAILRKELQRASDRVLAVVSELEALEDISPYLLLTYTTVQDELQLPENQRQEIHLAATQLQQQRNQLWEQSIDNPDQWGTGMKQLLDNFEAFLSDRLTEEQTTRLRQINRQLHLPFTFRVAAVEEALGLSEQQKTDIQNVIVANRPRLSDSLALPMDNRPPIEKVLLGEASGALTVEQKAVPLLTRQLILQTREKTTAAILQLLTPSQRQTWQQLVGEPLTVFSN